MSLNSGPSEVATKMMPSGVHSDLAFEKTQTKVVTNQQVFAAVSALVCAAVSALMYHPLG